MFFYHPHKSRAKTKLGALLSSQANGRESGGDRVRGREKGKLFSAVKRGGRGEKVARALLLLLLFLLHFTFNYHELLQKKRGEEGERKSTEV